MGVSIFGCSATMWFGLSGEGNDECEEEQL